MIRREGGSTANFTTTVITRDIGLININNIATFCKRVNCSSFLSYVL